jgi:putative (di)nucleoside polyphosphate hydrolase
MIDADGFRPNVGMILCNAQGQVLWAKRIGHNAWQFPQGGIIDGETPEQALYRELWEEVGLYPEHVKILAQTAGWLHYRLPNRYVRQDDVPPVCFCFNSLRKTQKYIWMPVCLLNLIIGCGSVIGIH